MTLPKPAWWISALLLVLAPAGAVAQGRLTAADLSGMVTDASGGALPGATVTATNVETNLARSAVSDGRGRYVMAALPPGTYRLKAQLSGFSDQGRDGVTLVLGQEASIDFTLGVGTKQETITVTGEGPVVEATRTVVSSVVNRDQIENLPSNGRNYASFALITPGVGASTTGSMLSFAGQRGRSNNVMIDGFDNNDQSVNGVRQVFSQEAIREFQVLTSSFSAEYGKAAGGALNVISKSGTNQIDGSVFMYYRNDALNAKDFFERYGRYDRAGEPVGDRIDRSKAPFDQKQWGATLGGPLRQDKTFFFLAFERQDKDANNFVNIAPAGVDALRSQGFVVEAGQNPESDLIDTYLAKIDHQWTPDHNLVVRAQYADIHDEGNPATFGGTRARSAGEVTLKKDWALTAAQTDILSPKLVNEARVLYARQTFDINALDAACNGACDLVGEGTPRVTISGVATVGVGNTPQPRKNYRVQFLDSISYFGGKHGAKAGIEINHVNNLANTLPINFAGNYVFLSLAAFQAGTPFTYDQAYGNPVNAYVLDDLALFVQDDWRLTPRLVLKGGVRYQRQWWPETNFEVSSISNARYRYSVKPDTNNVAPRLAAAWDVTGDGKTSLHAAYGMFFDYNFSGPIAITDGTYAEGQGRRGIQLRGADAAAAWRAPGHRIPEPTGSFVINRIVLPQDYDTPYSHQVSAGFDRALTRDLGLAVNFLYVHGQRNAGTLNYNPLLNATVNRRPNDTPCPAVSATCLAAPVPPELTSVISALGIPRSSAQVLEYKNYGSTWYRGMTVSLSKRYSHAHQFQLSYTLSKAENNIDDYLSVTEFSGYGRNPNDPTGLPLGFDPDYDRGPGALDQRHRVVLSGLVRLPGSFMLSTIMSGASGRPFSALSNTDFNGNGVSTERARRNPADPATELPRNSERMRGTFAVDLRLSKRFKLHGDTAIEGIVEAFNIFDRANFGSPDTVDVIDTNFGPGAFPDVVRPTYGQYTQALNPRQIQLAAKFIF